jgi:hypothetical protein
MSPFLRIEGPGMTDQNRNHGDGDHPGRSRLGGLVGALVLIAIGVIFLLQNMGYHLPGNWWALFLFIPAAYTLAGAWRSYRAAGGEVTMAVIGPLLGGLVLLALGLVFLFDLDVDWGLVMPIVLILLGAGALARSFLRR